jgi:hypothetical protein
MALLSPVDEISKELHRLDEYLDSLYELRKDTMLGGGVKRFLKGDTQLAFHSLKEIEDQIRRTEEKICALRNSANYYPNGSDCCTIVSENAPTPANNCKTDFNNCD